jgi:ribosome-associated toxin RatA of RatAB toxin-antitoxin module
MPEVIVQERIAAPAEHVWNAVCDVRSFPDIMEPVRSLTVLEEQGDVLVVAWEIELDGAILKWIDREQRDHASRTVHYCQIEGDLAQFEGYWQVRELESGFSEACMAVRFEIGIPMLREMLDPIAVRVLRENVQKMLRSLGAPAVRSQPARADAESAG